MNIDRLLTNVMMTLLIKSWIRITLSCWLLAISLTVSAAVEWSYESSLRAGLEYNDNIRVTTVDHDAVWGKLITPKLDLKAKSRLVSAQMGAEIQYANYTKNEIKNRNIQRYTILSSYQQTPRSQWGLAGYLLRDTVLTPVTSGSLPPGPVSAPGLSGIIPDPDEGDDNDARRNRLRLTPLWKRSLSQRSTLVLDYTLYDVTYVGDTGGATLIDNRTNSFGVSLKRSMTKRDLAGITVRYSEYEAPDVDSTADVFLLAANIEHRFSDTLTGFAEVGLNKTESSVGSVDDVSTNPRYRFRIIQDIFEATSFKLQFQRRLLPSGSGRIVESDRIDLGFRHRIKPTLTFSLKAKYFKNDTVGGSGVTTRDRWYYFLNPTLSKNLTRNWRVNGSYRYRRQKLKSNNKSADSNAVTLNFTYVW